MTGNTFFRHQLTETNSESYPIKNVNPKIEQGTPKLSMVANSDELEMPDIPAEQVKDDFSNILQTSSSSMFSENSNDMSEQGKDNRQLKEIHHEYIEQLKKISFVTNLSIEGMKSNHAVVNWFLYEKLVDEVEKLKTIALRVPDNDLYLFNSSNISIDDLLNLDIDNLIAINPTIDWQLSTKGEFVLENNSGVSFITLPNGQLNTVELSESPTHKIISTILTLILMSISVYLASKIIFRYYFLYKYEIA